MLILMLVRVLSFWFDFDTIYTYEINIKKKNIKNVKQKKVMVGRKVINTFLALPKTRHFHFTNFIFLILKHFEFGNVIF